MNKMLYNGELLFLVMLVMKLFVVCIILMMVRMSPFPYRVL